MRTKINSSRPLWVIVALAAVLPAAGFAQNTFQHAVDSGGRYYLTNTANWTEGVLPTGAGVINAGTDGTLETATGWTVVQNGSTIGISGAGLNTTLDDCDWTVNGGQLGDVSVVLKNSTKVTVNAGGTLYASGGRDLSVSGDAIVEVNGGTVSVGDQLWARDSTRIYGTGTFTFRDVEVLQNSVMNLTNSTITVSADFGQRSTKERDGSVTLNGCTMTAGFFKVLSSGFELTFAGAAEGSATFTDWSSDSKAKDDGMTVNFLAGTGSSMTLDGSARALVFSETTSTVAWAQALWDNNQLLYNGSCSTNLANLSWADATDSGIGVGNGEYFEFTPAGPYGGTLALVTQSSGYDTWAAGWSNSIGAATNDFDGDGLNNLFEYAMDGNPTNGLAPVNLPLFSRAGNGFIYVYPQRSDDTNLIYTVETTTNLVDSESWTNDGYTVTGTNVTGGTLDFVTNDVDTVDNEKFIRLKINQHASGD